MEIHLTQAPDRLEYEIQRRLGTGLVDVETYPDELRQPLRAFMERAGKLLADMITPEDGNDPIHFVVIENSSPNAFYIKVGHDLKVVGITLGLIETLECDDDLAFILGHELEHANAQLQKEVDGLRGRGDGISAMMLQRPVENEVDVKSVRRMQAKGKNPHTAVDWLKRMRDKFGDFPGRTHTMLATRITTIEGQIFGNVRGLGGGAEHRLDQSPRNWVVISDIKNTLFAGNRLKMYFEQKIDAILNSAGVADQYYEAVKKGGPYRHPKGVNTFYDQNFKQSWKKIMAMLPHSSGIAMSIDLQLRLARNLHEEFERARDRILGADFLPATPGQFEAMVELERRRYPINAPNLAGLLQKRDSLTEIIARGASGDGEADRLIFFATGGGQGGVSLGDIENAKKELRETELMIEAAKTLFEAGEAMECFVAGEYKEAKWASSDDLEFGDGYEALNLLGQIEKSGLKIRLIHDLIADASEREQRIRDKGQGQALMLAKDLDSFLKAYGRIQIYKLDVDTQRRVLQEARKFLDTFAGDVEIVAKVRLNIFRCLSDYAKELGEEVQALVVRELERALDDCRTVADVKNAGSILSSVLPFLGGHKKRFIAAFHENVLKTHLSAIDTQPDLFSALRQVAMLNRGIRDYRVSDISLARYRGAVPIAKQIAEKMRQSATRAGLNEVQLEALIYVEAPSLMPNTMGPADLTKIREAFVAICSDARLKPLFEDYFELYDTMYVFCDSEASLSEEEKALMDEIRKLEGESAARKSETRKRKIYTRLRDLSTARRTIAYDLLIAVRGVWRLEQDTMGEGFLGSDAYQSKDILRKGLLEKLASERPWDMESASILIRSNPFVDEPGREFFEANFAWHQQKYGSIEEAAYQFWRAVDGARVVPNRRYANGIVGFTTPLYNPVVLDGSGRPGNVFDLEKFEAYRRGVARFVGEMDGGALPQDQRRAEMSWRIEWEPLDKFLRDAENYKSHPPAEIAGAFLAYATGYEHFSASDKNRDVVNYLWKNKDAHPEVEEALKNPAMVRALPYQSSQVKLAKWQLEKVQGFMEYLTDYEAGRAALPGKGEVREIVKRCHEILRGQFNEPGPASYEILQFVEERLLPNEAETALLSGLRLNENNWLNMSALYGLDAPDYLAGKLKSDQERIEMIRYLAGISTEPPVLKDYNREMIDGAKSVYTRNGEIFRTLAIQAIIFRQYCAKYVEIDRSNQGLESEG